MGAVTMYLPLVREDGHEALPVCREVQPTLEAATALLDAESTRAGRGALVWTHEFGEAVARRGRLTYDVLPVQVALSEAAPAHDRMGILAGYTLSETPAGGTRLHRGGVLDDEVREWPLAFDGPTLADLCRAAFADHLTREGH